MGELSVRGENEKTFRVYVEAAHAVKVSAKKFVSQRFVQQGKDSLMFAVLVRADHILALVHHNVDIVLQLDFLVVNADDIFFNVKLKT